MPGFRITYEEDVTSHDIPQLDSAVKTRIRKVIDQKLTKHPELYGAPLKGLLHPLWKLRVGDYRVIYEILPGNVRVLAIGHRREIYKRAKSR